MTCQLRRSRAAVLGLVLASTHPASAQWLGQGAGGPLFDIAPPVEALRPKGWVGLDEDTLRAEIRKEMERLRALGGADRHAQGDLFHEYRPSAPSSILVVALEGTGAYEPMLAASLANLRNRLAPRLATEAANAVHRIASEEYQRLTGDSPLWSGLMAGPMAMLYRKAKLTRANVDWFSFPSEEAEVLAGISKLNLRKVLELPDDIERSVQSRPRGVQRAVAATLEYLQAAAEQGSRPRVVVLTHSSGGRSAVKVLDALAGSTDPRTGERGVEVDLVFSIDPVREAHEAIGEVLPQLAGTPLRAIESLWNDDVVLETKVWHRSQPESLFKPANARRWISMFQRADTEGLKIQPRFGIQGSPVHRADRNLEVTGLGSDGHGAICYDHFTLWWLALELEKLDPPRAS